MDEEFAHRRILYRLANLLDARSHFIFTNRGDLLDRATEDLQRTLESADTSL